MSTERTRGRPAPPVDAADAESYRDRHLRWNFGTIVIDCALFAFGNAVFDGATVLPLLLARLNASDTLIGFTRLVQTLGFTLPALLAAHYIHGRPYHKRFLVTAAGVARAGILTMPVALMLFAVDRPSWVVAWFFVVFGVFWMVDGGSAVSWYDIVGKTIPSRVRGRFFGTMQFASGLLAVAAAAIVTSVFENRSLQFPTDFAVLAGFWALGVALSWIALAMIREPVGVDDGGEKPGFLDFVRLAPVLLRRNAQVRRLILTRLMLDGASLAVPFYVLYAQRDLLVPAYMVGAYLGVKSVGRVVSGPLWGLVSDRLGATVGFAVMAAAVAVAPAMALMSQGGAAWLLLVAFFLLGAAEDGLWMTFSTALLNASEDRDRPLTMGIAAIFQTPAALYGPLGGLLATGAGYLVVFGSALGFACCGLGLAVRTLRKGGPIRTSPQS